MSDIAVLVCCLVVGGPLAYALAVARGRRRWGVLVAGSVLAVCAAVVPAQLLLASWLVLGVLAGACLIVFAAHMVVAAWLMLRQRASHSADHQPEQLPSIAVLVPARNEEAVIDDCLASLLSADYPRDRLRVLVIDDGSEDETAALVAARMRVDERVGLLSRTSGRGGKAEALNEGLAIVDADLVAVLDADHRVGARFFRVALTRLGEERVGAVQARTSGRNWSQNMLTRLVEMDFLGLQFCFLDVKSHLRLTSVCFGTGCLFPRHVLDEVGGFDGALATEDVEISFRLYEAGYRVVFEPRAHTDNELVAEARAFLRQRYRWARGTTQAVSLHARRFLLSKRTHTREKLDFLSYLFVVGLMVGPYLQLAVYSLTLARGVAAPGASLLLVTYATMITLYYFVAAVGNQQAGDVVGLRLRTAAYLAPAMIPYYLVYGVISLRAFLDEFALARPDTTQKAERKGREQQRPARRDRVATRHTQEERLLIALLRLDCGRPALTRARLGVDWALFDTLARAHDLAGVMHAALARAGLSDLVPPETLQRWRRYRTAVLARNLCLQGHFTQVISALGDEQVDVIALKGITLLEDCGVVDCRPTFDIDLLVPRASLPAADQALQRCGFRPLAVAGSWQTQRPYRHVISEAIIDLHWDVVNIYSYLQIHRYPASELWSRSAFDRELAARRLGAEDAIVHSALHWTVHHRLRGLRHALDLTMELERHREIADWDDIVRRARMYRFKSPLWLALSSVHSLLGAPVPPNVLAALEPSLFGRMSLRGHQRHLFVDPRGGIGWGRSSMLLADGIADAARVLAANARFRGADASPEPSQASSPSRLG